MLGEDGEESERPSKRVGHFSFCLVSVLRLKLSNSVSTGGREAGQFGMVHFSVICLAIWLSDCIILGVYMLLICWKYCRMWCLSAEHMCLCRMWCVLLVKWGPLRVGMFGLPMLESAISVAMYACSPMDVVVLMNWSNR